MVMHARKYPRLNDGYYSRNETHPYENMDKFPSKSKYNDRYYDKTDESPSSRHRDESPVDRPSPRYQNKASYIEKTKEKLERGSSGSPGDRRHNHQASFHSSSSTSKSNSNHNNYDRDHKNGREVSTKKDVRSEVHKSALRVCGDWSEHTSSSGKKYYYNCKTEVSQWEKPKDWHDNLCHKPEHRYKERGLEKQSSLKSDDDKRHSILGGDKNDRLHRTSLSLSHGSTISSKTSNNSDHSRVRHDSSTEHSQRHGQSLQRTSSMCSEHSNDSLYKGHGRASTDRRDSRSISFNQSDGRLSHSQDNRHRESEDGPQTEDMDISPGSTPTNSSRPCSRQHSHSTTPIVNLASSLNIGMPSSAASSATVTPAGASLPQILTQMNDTALQNLNSQEITQQALQTLQKLQQALSRQVTQNAISQSPPSVTSETPSPFTSPTVNSNPHPARIRNDSTTLHSDDGGVSPRSDQSFRSSRHGSPTPSQGSSQGLPIANSLAAVSIKPSSTVELTPSLANYYDEKLITHVTGWQGALIERQADHYMEDAHTVGSLHCTQVSADLKKARSLVRIAEIQSTLQEQRILFLIQQIKELETVKSQNTFMSS